MSREEEMRTLRVDIPESLANALDQLKLFKGIDKKEAVIEALRDFIRKLMIDERR